MYGNIKIYGDVSGSYRLLYTYGCTGHEGREKTLGQLGQRIRTFSMA